MLQKRKWIKLVVKILVGYSNRELASVFLNQVNTDMEHLTFHDSTANLSKFVKLPRAVQPLLQH